MAGDLHRIGAGPDIRRAGVDDLLGPLLGDAVQGQQLTLPLQRLNLRDLYGPAIAGLATLENFLEAILEHRTERDLPNIRARGRGSQTQDRSLAEQSQRELSQDLP